MPDVKVNFIPEEDRDREPIENRPPKKHNFRKIIASVVIIAIIVLAVFSSSIVFSDESFTKNLSALGFVQQVSRLISSRDKKLQGEKNDRVNLLIIGMGGKNHEGGTLADTILLTSLKPSTNQVAMFSIPRDLSIYTDEFGQVKINSVHAYAEVKEEGSGGQAMVETINDLLGTDIHYYVTVDFDGFERIIDEFGGVDINVENDLIDPEYPVRGKEDVYPYENRFEYLKIEKGQQHMDGSLALKYARSRHALNLEGSDFARSRRQQKIILAMKEKILSFGTLFNPRRLSSLLSAYRDHIITDLKIWELLRLAQLSKDIDTSAIITQTLDDGPDGALYSDNMGGAYVLLPKNDDFTIIKNLWQYIFYKDGIDMSNVGQADIKTQEHKNIKTTTADETPTETGTPPSSPSASEGVVSASLRQEAAKIEIQNGTWVEGYAGREKTKLTNAGFTVSGAINATKHDYTSTIVYDLSNGQFPETAKELIKAYNRPTTTEIPAALDSSSDFVIILGQN